MLLKPHLLKSYLGLLLIFLLSRCSISYPRELALPEGFISQVFVDSIPQKVRHLAVDDNGDVYAKLQKATAEGALAGIRDLDGDGHADQIETFGQYPHQQKGNYSTAVRIYNGYLYFSSQLGVYRYKLDPKDLTPKEKIEIVVVDDHPHGSHEHIGKPIAFDDQGHLYVPFGAPSNACQNPKRVPMQAGQDPCPQLENHGGIWQFDANTLGQTQKDAVPFATGLRSIVALDWNPKDKNLYAVVHGRDDLLRLWPDRYSAWESALLPAEEFIKIPKDSDFGWPYCYYDQIQELKVLAPEYGGDGEIVGRCAQFNKPIIGFPGHWAPNDLVFYKGNHFPEYYKNGAFIAFHGSTNRAPYPQAGYFIAFVPFKNGKFLKKWDVFADGFAQIDPIINVKDATYRPMGITFGGDGAMYIGDTEKGRIWKVEFKGDKASFGKKQLAEMEEHKKRTHIRTPDKIKDMMVPKEVSLGQKTYNLYCGACHQQNGKGASGRFPPLDQTDWVTGDKERLIDILLNGKEGVMTVNGVVYDGLMPQHHFLSDKEIAAVLSYIRTNFGNTASPITPEEVKKYRTSSQNNLKITL